MSTFDDFWNEIVSDEIWFEQLKMRHPKKDWREAAMEIYTNYLADRNFPEMREVRKHLNNKLIYKKQTDEATVYRKPQEPLSQNDFNHNPLTDEERRRVDAMLDEYKALLRDGVVKPVPKLSHEEILQEGGFLPKPKEKYIPPKNYEMKEQLRKSAKEFYKHLAVSFNMSEVKGFQVFYVNEFEIFAQSQKDAQSIYDNAVEERLKQLES